MSDTSWRWLEDVWRIMLQHVGFRDGFVFFLAEATSLSLGRSGVDATEMIKKGYDHSKTFLSAKTFRLGAKLSSRVFANKYKQINGRTWKNYQWIYSTRGLPLWFSDVFSSRWGKLPNFDCNAVLAALEESWVWNQVWDSWFLNHLFLDVASFSFGCCMVWWVLLLKHSYTRGSYLGHCVKHMLCWPDNWSRKIKPKIPW